MMHFPKTVIFWGAGATAALGMRTTEWQSRFIHTLTWQRDGGQKKSLCQRVSKALAGGPVDGWQSELTDLLSVVGDETDSITRERIDAMRKNWCVGASEDDLQARIAELQNLYDWPALKATVAICPGADQEGAFRLSDLFNVLDMHIRSGHGFRAGDDEFLTPQRLLGARNALDMVLQTMFYIDWQRAIRDAGTRSRLEQYRAFAQCLGRRMQRHGVDLAGSVDHDSRAFYMADVAIVSMNYDPLALWLQYIANRELNQSPVAPYVGSPARKLQVFVDLGQFAAGRRIKQKDGAQQPWHQMNESAAQRLNDEDHGASQRIRISKTLFPHGCLCWRECPDCGRVSAYMGDSWSLESPTLIPPPPLRAFAEDRGRCIPSEEERAARARGEVDARACEHCGTLTYAHHTRTAMQSNFKGPPPPFVEEIRRDLRTLVQHAEHIVLMGYSLPPDDVEYRAFFAARRRRDPDNPPAKCSIVSLDAKNPDNGRWLGPSEWPGRLCGMKKAEPPGSTLEAARDLFGEENVRFYGGGVPEVFMEGGRVNDAAVKRLLEWNDGG